MSNGKELLSGSLFLLLGGGAVAVACGYPVGSAARMGPGYFPILVGGVLAAIGLAKLALAFARPAEGGQIGRLPLRPVLLVPGAVVAFALLLLRAGLLPAIAALVLLACLAGSRLRPLEAVLIFAAVSVIAGLLWVEGLGFPVQSLLLVGR